MSTSRTTCMQRHNITYLESCSSERVDGRKDRRTDGEDWLLKLETMVSGAVDHSVA